MAERTVPVISCLTSSVTLALIGKPIKGRIIATRPGHTINNKFARQMRKEIRLHEIQAPVLMIVTDAPIMDVNRIRELAAAPLSFPTGR